MHLSPVWFWLLTLVGGWMFASPVQAVPWPLGNPHCRLLAQAARANPYGTTGQTGQTGANGTGGSNADDVTLFADGSPLTLNLAGKGGEDGAAGGDGESPDCGNQPLDARQNLQAADGGNGGNGGNGGDGGNGGSITLYATNLENLRQILVNANGGKGGAPGTGGQGSQGCICSKPYWTVDTCTGEPGGSDYRCSTQEFRCTNGRNGVNGNNGLAGRDGLPGRLTVLNLNKPLEADRQAATVTLGILKENGFTLSKNRWETRTGATTLLAPGSAIADEYLMLTERVEKSFLLIWNAPQPFSAFGDRNVTLSLDERQEIQVNFPEQLWLEGISQKRNQVTEFVVYNALYAGDATQLGNLSITGNGNQLKLLLTDQAGKSNLIATKFRLRYKITESDPRFRPPTDYATKFDGEVPEELVSARGDQFVINLGQLPIAPEYLRPGLGIEVELVANRTFAGYSAEQKLTVRDVISASGGLNYPKERVNAPVPKPNSVAAPTPQ